MVINGMQKVKVKVQTKNPYINFMQLDTSKKLLLIVTTFWMANVILAIYSAMTLGIDLTPILSYTSTAFMVEVTAYSAKAGYEKRYQYPEITEEQIIEASEFNPDEVPIDTSTIDRQKGDMIKW